MENHLPPKDETYLSSVISKRIRLFEQIQAEQLQSLPHDPIKITLLPDGIVKEGNRWETTPMDIAGQISRVLAESALVSSVNRVLWDMNRPLEGDCSLEIFRFDSDQGRDTFWHSSAHLLGQALKQEFGCKLCLGPCETRGNIEARVAKAVRERQPFERIEVTKDQALKMFSDNKFKVKIINGDLAKKEKFTVYRCGPLVDLCPGPHIPNTSLVKAFKCLKASPAYRKGHRKRKSLERVYGISYPDDEQLKDFLISQELFFSHPFSTGSFFFLPLGARVYDKLVKFIKAEYCKRGYTEVISPNVYNMKLWETSGLAENDKENMFTFDINKQKFGLKPMNCHGHCLMFQHRFWSYKELPIRLADFGALHRNEESIALSGLTRVRRFQQDDAHVFCRATQVEEEVKGILDFVDYVYTIFGFTYELKLSTRPKKYIGDLEKWDKAEVALEKALKDFGKPFLINKGDGEIYGPKIDITLSDAMKRNFQCATLQLDFQLPESFTLEYSSSAEDETKSEQPVLIHRAVLGSVERMFSILLEQCKGKWPFWLSPRQAIVCSSSKDDRSYADKVRDQIHKAGYYVDADTTDRNVSEKVKEAQVARYNYILVVGEEDARRGQVTVWLRDEVMSIEALLDEFKLKTANFL
ncbi:PREDICTED: threonine--tRNA ligase, mitochondrial 1-like [Camelina sativa]|uniref:threonine--tRNA ligase n=1 Tax=Camelina sativa TaxID=90675 RepID=A0ABM1R7S8_CAMSA|nr:PREDICTED: threonine--tRNA ligase, mitochondrial 1-like [Camelina sativa]